MSTDLNMEYQEVKFGEIANHISKRVEPSETTLEVYVGLEHLDPDSLKITRHGVPSDVAGQKLLVKKVRSFLVSAVRISVRLLWQIGIVFVQHMRWYLKPFREKFCLTFYRSLCSLISLWKELLRFPKARYLLRLNGKI